MCLYTVQITASRILRDVITSNVSVIRSQNYFLIFTVREPSQTVCNVLLAFNINSPPINSTSDLNKFLHRFIDYLLVRCNLAAVRILLSSHKMEVIRNFTGVFPTIPRFHVLNLFRDAVVIFVIFG
jgi:hypothetical protein